MLYRTKKDMRGRGELCFIIPVLKPFAACYVLGRGQARTSKLAAVACLSPAPGVMDAKRTFEVGEGRQTAAAEEQVMTSLGRRGDVPPISAARRRESP